MTNQETVRSTDTSIGTNTSTDTCTYALENASIVRTLFDLFIPLQGCMAAPAHTDAVGCTVQLVLCAGDSKRTIYGFSGAIGDTSGSGDSRAGRCLPF